MTDVLMFTEEMTAGPARIRIDVRGGEPREHVLEDMNFMNYRLADVQLSPGASLPRADIIWNVDGAKSVTYHSGESVVTFTGPVVVPLGTFTASRLVDADVTVATVPLNLTVSFALVGLNPRP